jgi:hypothetical protein
VLEPDPAVDPVAYDRLCRQKPNATDCGLPLYWPAPRQRLSTKAGLHRFTWDMRYQPVAATNIREGGEVEATGAVPHRSVHTPTAPWAVPGPYVARLTADGRSVNQLLVLRLDPRIKTSAAGLRQLAALSREMYNLAVAAHAAHVEARARVGSLTGTTRAQVESLAPLPSPSPQRGPRPAARPGQPAPSPTLEGASNAALAAAMAMQDADVTPTAAQVAACARARAEVNQVLVRWARLQRRSRSR